MEDDSENLEPIAPDRAVELSLDDKSTDCADSTIHNYRYRLNFFIDWCEEEEVHNLNVLSGRDTQRFRLWRRNQADLTGMTLKNQMQVLRTFLEWAESGLFRRGRSRS